MCTGDLRLPIAATVALKDAIAVLTGFERNTEGGKLIITTAGLPDCAASPTDQADCASRNSPDGNKVNSYECRATPPRSSGCTSYRRARRVLNIVRIGSTQISRCGAAPSGCACNTSVCEMSALCGRPYVLDAWA
jgi:hypothetical protein